MDNQNLILLATELRARALNARGKEREELLFLAAEYEKLIGAPDPETATPFKVVLPK